MSDPSVFDRGPFDMSDPYETTAYRIDNHLYDTRATNALSQEDRIMLCDAIRILFRLSIKIYPESEESENSTEIP